MSRHDEILKHFKEVHADLDRVRLCVEAQCLDFLMAAGVRVQQISSRLKSEESLSRKLKRKPKYSCLTDITDLIGIRIITYDSADADKAARVIRQMLRCDWDNCEDKRDRLRSEQFGYRSDHYVIYPGEPLPNSLNKLRLEVQIRTVLQHAWAEIEHDELGYHSESLVPADIRRRLARAAALLEAVDSEFVEIRRLARKAEPRKLRAEGLAEAIGEIEFSLDCELLREKAGHADLTLYFNVNVTPSLGGEKEPLLIVEDSAVSKPVRGELCGANAIRFRDAFPAFMTGGLKHIRCLLRGVRVNANQLGVSATRHMPTEVVLAVAPTEESSKGLVDVLQQVKVALILQGLQTRCRVLDDRLASGWAGIECEFIEGFPGAFKDSLAESAGDRIAKRPTRFRIFLEESSGADVWVTCQNCDRPTTLSASLGANLIECDGNGGGIGLYRAHEREIRPLIEEDPVRVARPKRQGAAHVATWELDLESSLSPTIGRLTFRVFFRPPANLPVTVRISQTLAPLSTVTTPSKSELVPRFADTSLARVFTVFPAP